MLESARLPGGVAMPRLRWRARMGKIRRLRRTLPSAFDTFESKVVPEDWPEEGKPRRSGPFRAFGLLSFYERDYASAPTPLWRSTIPQSGDGEKHPSERGHSERLERAIQAAVARNAGVGNRRPVPRRHEPAVSRRFLLVNQRGFASDRQDTPRPSGSGGDRPPVVESRAC